MKSAVVLLVLVIATVVSCTRSPAPETPSPTTEANATTRHLIVDRVVAMDFGDSTFTDTVNSPMREGILASMRVDSIVVAPDTLSLRVGDAIPFWEKVAVTAFDTAGRVVPHFAPMLQIGDRSVARLDGINLVGVREGETVLLYRPLPVRRDPNRRLPSAALVIRVIK